jgi:hypothetical protein
MGDGIDADLPVAEYERMLEEVRAHLPAYLSGAATMRRDMLADVRELLHLDDKDLKRLLAVHVSLDQDAVALVEALDEHVPQPRAASSRTTVVSQTARGALDWPATIRRRATTGNDGTLFATRLAEKDPDTVESRVLVWVVDTLGRATRRAGGSAAPSAPRTDLAKWPHLLNAMAAKLSRIQRARWIASAVPRRPSGREIHQLAASRSRFFQEQVWPVAAALLKADDPGPEAITDILCRLYFEPDKVWRLYELTVALRLARAFNDPANGLVPRPARLVRGAPGAGAYATYDTADGGTVALSYQGWPKDVAESSRSASAARHGLHATASIPDILVIRRDEHGAVVDVLVLELKASVRAKYLVQGLSQLLSYLGEHPGLFGRPPAAWLVAPASDAFSAAARATGSPLWIVDAADVADHAVAWVAGR